MRDDKAKSVVAKQLQDFTVGNGMLDLKTGQISTKRLAGSTCHYIMGFITVVAHISTDTFPHSFQASFFLENLHDTQIKRLVFENNDG